MALIDEYKQAIQDVLDGRAKPAPKPSELPWTEDKLASMWAAAAAELIAEASGSSGGGVLVVTETTETVDEGIKHTLDKTYAEITASDLAVKKYVDSTGDANISTVSCYGEEGGAYYVQFTDEVNFYEATSASGTLSYIGR